MVFVLGRSISNNTFLSQSQWSKLMANVAILSTSNNPYDRVAQLRLICSFSLLMFWPICFMIPNMRYMVSSSLMVKAPHCRCLQMTPRCSSKAPFTNLQRNWLVFDTYHQGSGAILNLQKTKAFGSPAVIELGHGGEDEGLQRFPLGKYTNYLGCLFGFRLPQHVHNHKILTQVRKHMLE